MGPISTPCNSLSTNSHQIHKKLSNESMSLYNDILKKVFEEDEIQTFCNFTIKHDHDDDLTIIEVCKSSYSMHVHSYDYDMFNSCYINHKTMVSSLI